jgi:hypothetical protein
MDTTTPKPLNMKRPLSPARQESLRKAHAALAAKRAAEKTALNTANGQPVAVPVEVLKTSIATVIVSTPEIQVESEPVVEDTRPHVRLVGEDGNAFMILGLCQKAARRAGWSPEKIAAVMDEMKAGDYNHLLATAMKHFDVE